LSLSRLVLQNLLLERWEKATAVTGNTAMVGASGISILSTGVGDSARKLQPSSLNTAIYQASSEVVRLKFRASFLSIRRGRPRIFAVVLNILLEKYIAFDHDYHRSRRC
jgi:hypothetical protein